MQEKTVKDGEGEGKYCLLIGHAVLKEAVTESVSYNGDKFLTV